MVSGRQIFVLIVALGALVAAPGAGTAQAHRPTLRKWPPGLFEVASCGDLEQLMKLLDADPALVVDAYSTSGTSNGKAGFTDCFTLLHEAANFGHLEGSEPARHRPRQIEDAGASSTTPLNWFRSV